MKEWINWKVVYGTVREDSHRAEWVDVETGEVVKDSTIRGAYGSYMDNEIETRRRNMRLYKSKTIHRNDIGDVFCTTDWSKH